MLGGKKEHKLLIKGTTEEIEKAISEIEKTYLKEDEDDKTIYDDPDTLMSSMQNNNCKMLLNYYEVILFY